VTAQPNPFAPHWLIRDIVIGSHRAAVGQGGLLFVGDSLVEGFYWNRLGPLPVLNAGYAGIWTEALEPRVPLLLKAAHPTLAVLLVGTNDAKKDCTESSLGAVEKHYGQIVGHCRDVGVPLIVLTPPPVEPGKRITSFYSPEAMASLSHRIVALAKGQVAGIVDLQRAFADENGQARAGLTTDGIHLSGQGYRMMHEMLEKMVAAVVAGRQQ
jgi:lysophospholipase L1-like esterase